MKYLTENSEQIDAELVKILAKVKKNAYIMDKLDKVNNAMTAYDITALTAAMEEIKNEEIEIDEELYIKAEELIEMAAQNPTFIADKQKEAAKAAKSKKK